MFFRFFELRYGDTLLLTLGAPAEKSIGRKKTTFGRKQLSDESYLSSLPKAKRCVTTGLPSSSVSKPLLHLPAQQCVQGI